MANILVVDDEIGIRELLSEILGDEGHVVQVAENAAQARACRQSEPPDLVLLDIWMPDTDGVTLLKEWSSGGTLTMPVIMMSGHGTIDTAVEATRIGAIDFLEKPIALQKLLKAVQRGLDRDAQRKPARPAASLAPAAGSATVIYTANNVATGVSESGVAVAHPAVAASTAEAAADSEASDLPAPRLQHGELPLDLPLREARDAFERVYFEHHLTRENGSMTRVAERTGLERTHLYRKLKQLGIELNKANKK